MLSHLKCAFAFLLMFYSGFCITCTVSFPCNTCLCFELGTVLTEKKKKTLILWRILRIIEKVCALMDRTPPGNHPDLVLVMV